MVAAGCEGMSFHGVERRMTLHHVMRLNKTWARNGPPSYVVTARANGWKPVEEQTEDQRFDDLVRMLGNGGG